MNFLNIIFPLFDHLYIYQLLEYQPLDFIKWFLKHPLKRNLQRKHKLGLSSKVLVLSVLSLFLLVIFSFLGSLWMMNLFVFLIYFLIFSFFSPIFILLSGFLLYPYENYQKEKIKAIARKKLKTLLSLKIVAIVGSFAKTSTKNILYTLLWKDFYVLKTPKSFNTEISIARTIASDLKTTTEVFIVEMDAYHEGDIRSLSSIVQPDLAILTSIAPQHLERFGSMDSLAKTQFEIADSIKEGGQLFLNAENEIIMSLEKNYPVKKVFYSGNTESQFYATHIEQTITGTKFVLHQGKEELTINLPLFGTHNVENFLAATAVAVNLGMSLKRIQERASLVLPTEHRLEIRQLGNFKVIDNTYNTNPKVAISSLKLLSDLKGSKKIIITPGLIELGDKAFEENKLFAIRASKVADTIIIVGANAKKALLAGLKEENYPSEKIRMVSTTKKALELLADLTQKDSIVLLENDLPDQYF